MRRIFFIGLICVIAGVVSNASIQTQSDEERVKVLIEEGDFYSMKKFDNWAALERFEKALLLDPNNAEILWRISRSYVDIGEHLPMETSEHKKKQLEAYEKAKKFANDAILVNPKSAKAFTMRAIASGRIALFKGVWESLDLVGQTKADLEQSIKLNPNDDAPYYVLARTHHKVSEKPRIIRWPLGLAWASIDDAIKNYEKSISIHQGFIMYRLDCARAYVEIDDYASAKRHLNIIPSLETLDEDDDQFRREAKELLEKIKDKK